MTRINAGSTLVNQYAPPFVVSDSVANNWELRYNSTLLAFEAFDPSENVIEAGFDTIEQQLFLGVTNQQVFVLPWIVASEAALYITIDGVKQHTSEFTISTNIASNTTTVTTGALTGNVEFIGLQTTGGATVELQTAVGDGTLNQTVQLTWLAPNEQSLLITILGIKQDTSEYSISSNAGFTQTTVTFDGTIGAGDAIEIVGITTTGEVPASPVNASNLPGGEGIFGIKRVVGETQILDFKSLIGGANITLISDDNSIRIESTSTVFDQIGGGTSIFDNNDEDTDPAVFRTFAPAGDRILLSVVADSITIDYNIGYVTSGTSPITAGTTDRLISVTGAGVFAVDLLAASAIPTGDTITIKNTLAGPGPITITPASGLIQARGNGALGATHVISTDYGYVTLYSDGTNYLIISEG